MKKSALIIALVAGSVAVKAQDLTSKKGETILPEEGDYALGFDASPFLNYVGNFLNSNSTAPSADFTNADFAIMGKMFKDAQTAYRGRVRIGFGSTSNSFLHDNTAQDSPDPDFDLVDKEKTSYNNIVLSAGMEKRRGNTRVQGLYGAEALIGFSGQSTKYEYAQELSDAHPAHNTFFQQSTGLISSKTGTTITVGARAFAGVEIFIFPKTSVAFEYGWGLALTSTGKGSTITETWDGTDKVSTEGLTGGNSSFGIDTDNNGGALTILFHF